MNISNGLIMCHFYFFSYRLIHDIAMDIISTSITISGVIARALNLSFTGIYTSLYFLKNLKYIVVLLVGLKPFLFWN